jgi:hypothetical protein
VDIRDGLRYGGDCGDLNDRFFGFLTRRQGVWREASVLRQNHRETHYGPSAGPELDRLLRKQRRMPARRDGACMHPIMRGRTG